MAELGLKIPESQRSATNVTIARSESLSSIDDVKAMLANNVPFSGLIVSPTGISRGGPVLIFMACSYILYLLLKSSEFLHWEAKFCTKQLQLYVILFMTIDTVFSTLAMVALNSANVAWVIAGHQSQLFGDLCFGHVHL